MLAASVVIGGDASPVFQTAEKVLDLVTFLVAFQVNAPPFITWPWLLGWRNAMSADSCGCGGLRRIRTGLRSDGVTVPYVAPSWRHSAIAASRFFLKSVREERRRSWLKWFVTEAWTAANI